jgi:hypothetical protein
MAPPGGARWYARLVHRFLPACVTAGNRAGDGARSLRYNAGSGCACAMTPPQLLTPSAGPHLAEPAAQVRPSRHDDARLQAATSARVWAVAMSDVVRPPWLSRYRSNAPSLTSSWRKGNAPVHADRGTSMNGRRRPGRTGVMVPSYTARVEATSSAYATPYTSSTAPPKGPASLHRGSVYVSVAGGHPHEPGTVANQASWSRPRLARHEGGWEQEWRVTRSRRCRPGGWRPPGRRCPGMPRRPRRPWAAGAAGPLAGRVLRAWLPL